MIAKIKDYAIGVTKAGLPQIVIQFETEDGQVVKWYGSLKDKARQYTIDTLVKVCDFEGHDLKVIGKGTASGALNDVKEYDVTIEEYEGTDGKTHSKIAWVNLPGSGKFNKLDENEAADLLKGYDFKNDLAVARAEKPKSPAPVSDEDVGF